MAHRRQVIEIAGANIFLKFVNGGNGCGLERKRLRRGILPVFEDTEHTRSWRHQSTSSTKHKLNKPVPHRLFDVAEKLG